MNKLLTNIRDIYEFKNKDLKFILNEVLIISLSHILLLKVKDFIFPRAK